MNKATLNYTTKDNKTIVLNSSTLYEIDKYTRNFKGDKEVFEKYYNKISAITEKVDGSLNICYYKSAVKKEIIPILYKQKTPLYIKDDYITNNISEIEKARRLIFSSKKDIFSKMILNDDILSPYTYYFFELMNNEVKILTDLNIKMIYRNNHFYVRLDELIKYNMNNKKLGNLRNIFESILSSWKLNIEELTEDELYFVSRELRLLINEYEIVKNKIININKIRISKRNIPLLKKAKLVTKQRRIYIHNLKI